MKRLTEFTSATVQLRTAKVRGCFSRETVLTIRRKTLPLMLSCMLFITLVVGVVYGQSQDRYLECQRRAREVSGYGGEVPEKHLPGGAFKEGVKGAVKASIIAKIAGKDKSKAAKRGAKIGSFVGALKRKMAHKEIAKRRGAYQREMEKCMRESAGSSGRATRMRDDEPTRTRYDEPTRMRDDKPTRTRDDEPTGASVGAFNLKSMTCWEAMSIPKGDRALALLLMYGYVAGKEDESTHSAERIKSTLSNFGKFCQNSDTPATFAMTKALTDTVFDVSAGEKFNLAETTCWEVISLSDEGYTFAMVLMYGYAAGQLGQSAHTVEKIQNVFARVSKISESKVDSAIIDIFKVSLRQESRSRR